MMNNINPSSISEQRHRMIETAAYYRAEKRGFSGGDAIKDWIEAEREIDVSFQPAVPADTGRQEAADAVEKMGSRRNDLSANSPGFFEIWKHKGSRFLNEARTALDAWVDRNRE
jgi:hypothetical protein